MNSDSPANAETASSFRKALRGLLAPRFVALLALLAALAGFFSYQSPYFFTLGNFLNILNQLPEIGFVALAMTLVIISGAMDLSVGSVVGLAAAVLGLASKAGLSIQLAIVLALVVGAVCGAINGYLVAYCRMQAVVVTIGTMVCFRGVIYILTGGRPLSGFPEDFYFLGQGNLLGLPFNAVVLLVVAIAAHFLLNKTVFGRTLFALGNNEEALRYSGAPVLRIRFLAFVLSGLLSAVAGVFLVSRLASAEATSGNGFELQAIIAVLLGGTSIFGGSGSVVGTAIGLLIIGVLGNGLNVMGVSTIVQTLLLGIMILVAAMFGSTRRKVMKTKS